MSAAYDESRVRVINHPMVQHKLSILRDEKTTTKDFRQLVHELALFEGYEATSDLELKDVEINTPLETCTCKQIAKNIVVVPILRAGLGMADGILELIPNAHVGHVGMYRDPKTHEPRQYYCKLPNDIADSTCLVVDPMLATGGSATAAIHFLREAGAKDIRMLFLVSAPEGLQAVLEYDPKVQVYTCAVDRQLNDNAYILPGLGDAGDRIYGTK
ncbi:MAG: uracil phosphoribosyltransferase [Atopobiaceae bacterium]|nr:uracil phosphoribosyltransferase [Atopobiaceae bacterium]